MLVLLFQSLLSSHDAPHFSNAGVYIYIVSHSGSSLWLQLLAFSLSLMPLTFDGKHSLEAARAAALAAHSDAGLASAAGLRTAARLLRSSKALARAAIAALQDSASQREDIPHAHGGGATGRGGAASAGHGAPLRTPGASPASRPRRRRHKKKDAEKDQNMDACAEVLPLVTLDDAVPKLSADASVFVPGAKPQRVLVARGSRERTPPPRSQSTPAPSSSSMGSSAAPPVDSSIVVGSVVIFCSLVSRAELVGMAGTVLSFDAASSRYAVKVDSTGECVRVLLKNLKPSLLAASMVA